MTDLLIKNGLIATMDADRRVIVGGSIAIENGHITAVGRNIKLKDKPEETIDAKGKVVIPGLICSHTHLHCAFLHGFPAGISPSDFSQVLRQIRWPFEGAMTREDAYVSALAGSLKFIKSGVTFIANTYPGPSAVSGSLDRISSAIESAGIRGIIGFDITERSTSAEAERGVRENEHFLRKIKRERARKTHGMFSVHASPAVSDELLYHIRELASRYGVQITIQASESLAELYSGYEKFGKRVIERLNDIRMLGPDVVLAHCVHVNRSELAIVKKTGTKVAHVPVSDMLNAVGVAPVVEMMGVGIPLGLGDDGYFLDAFQNIRLARLLHKLVNRDPSAMSPGEVLGMATTGGAELYGLRDKMGSLEPGKLADVVILNPSSMPTPIVRENALEQLVNFDRDAVGTVVVGGTIVMRQGEVLTLDEGKVTEMARGSAWELWQRLRG